MEAVDSHGFRPGAPTAAFAAPGAPVLDVQPLRAVSPLFPHPGHPLPFASSSPAPFIYISPFSQFAAGFAPLCQPFDPAEVRRKVEQEIASREKRAKRSAVRNFLKSCAKTSVANGSTPGQPSSSSSDVRKTPVKNGADDRSSPSKSEPKRPAVPKTELCEEEDVFVKAKKTSPAKTPVPGKSPNCRNAPAAADEPQSDFTPRAESKSGAGAPESSGKKRKKGSESRPSRNSKGTKVFRATEGDESAASDRKLVRRALVIYDSLRRKLMQEDEATKEAQAPGGGGCKRPDLKAGTIMMDRGLCLNRDRRIIGSVPGVHVGDLFYFRMELCVIGLHGHVMAGIDYINAKCNHWNEPVATSIISSGGYEDDEDDGEVLIYTGQGGNNYKTDKKQTDDQKLERGNLALERSMHHGVEIRVIRGIKDSASPSGKTYIYDGLYKVQESWLDKGRSGFSVFKYRLQRIPGQPELGSAILKSTRQWKSQPCSREGLLLDVSSRNENLPVYLVNDVDDDKEPPRFEYISNVRYSNSISKLEPSRGCDCKSSCASGDKCSCISLNGGEIPYNPNGYLVKGKSLVYECGDLCRCPPSCRNRVSQKGLKNHFEVFKTNDRGWGVRSWDPIPAGSFVCEYTGEVLSDSDTEQDDEGNEYLLHANRIQKSQAEWDSIFDILSEKKEGTSSQVPPQLSIAIDASKIGNVSRFMNHSCSPNLFRQPVLYDHYDTQFPHIMLFAIENIPPLTELTFDYGLSLSQIGHTEGKGEDKGAGKGKVCLCGTSECRGKFY